MVLFTVKKSHSDAIRERHDRREQHLSRRERAFAQLVERLRWARVKISQIMPSSAAAPWRAHTRGLVIQL